MDGWKSKMDDPKRKDAVRLEIVDGVPVVQIDGEIDIVGIGEFNESLRLAAQQDVGAVVVSLERASYFDSAAIHALISCRARLSASRQGLFIVQPSTAAGRRILEIAGLLRDDTVVATLAEAVGLAQQLTAQRRQTP
jgi:anti-anti-sigma factor